MNQPLNEQELEALLPWYLNGTLDADEQQQIDHWLQTSEQAREALEQLQLIQQQVQEQDSVTAPIDMGWQRFKQQLPTDSQQAQKQASPFNWQRLMATAAAVVIAVQFALLMNIEQPQDGRLLSGDNSTVTNPAAGVIVKVMPADDASWQALQGLLAQADASIIGGPSSMGLLTLQLSDAQPTDARIELLQSSALITHLQVVSDE